MSISFVCDGTWVTTELVAETCLIGTAHNFSVNYFYKYFICMW